MAFPRPKVVTPFHATHELDSVPLMRCSDQRGRVYWLDSLRKRFKTDGRDPVAIPPSCNPPANFASLQEGSLDPLDPFEDPSMSTDDPPAAQDHAGGFVQPPTQQWAYKADEIKIPFVGYKVAVTASMNPGGYAEGFGFVARRLWNEREIELSVPLDGGYSGHKVYKIVLPEHIAVTLMPEVAREAAA